MKKNVSLFVIPFQKWFKTNEMRLALFKWLFYRHRAHNRKLKQKTKNELQFFFIILYISLLCFVSTSKNREAFYFIV